MTKTEAYRRIDMNLNNHNNDVDASGVKVLIQEIYEEQETRICENCSLNNLQGSCPLYSMYHGHNQFKGLGVSCDAFKRRDK